MIYRRQWRVYASAVRYAVIMGVVFGSTAGSLLIEPPLMGALFGVASATLDFSLMMAVIGAMEIFLPRTELGRRLLGGPFLITVLAKAVAYLAVVVVVLGGRIGPRVTLLAFSPDIARQIVAQAEAHFPRGLLIVITAMVIFLMVMLRNASQLVGERTFRDIVRGRYHRPRREERFFLFVDIVGSTPVAERLGPLAVNRYLSRVFEVTSDPVDAHYGEVYQYVGDEIVVTWTVPEGCTEARPLACLFAIQAALAAAAPEFKREFGVVPEIRAALHAGEVVTSEIGGSRRAIVFHGDVMNTTSRIENATRTLGQNFLVSEDALARLEGAERYAPEDLGPQQLRGREALMRVHAVRAA